jgi:hypothetical protein
MKRCIGPIGAVALLLALPGLPLGAQGFPIISGRSYIDGTARVVLTGSFTITDDIALNKQASFGDGEMTWIQFGVSGADEPNALITYNAGSKEVGLIFGRGKKTTTAGIMEGEPSPCSGKTDVTAKLVSGHYVCKGVTSYDPATGKMGKVDIEITFTAKS